MIDPGLDRAGPTARLAILQLANSAEIGRVCILWWFLTLKTKEIA